MKLSEIIGVIEKWAPKKHAEDFDNVGLLVGDSDSEISKGLITLDTTLEIIDEAISKDCNLIITFHPLIFNPIKKINSDDRINKIIINFYPGGRALLFYLAGLETVFSSS